MPKHTGYKMASEDWDVHRVQKKKWGHESTIYPSISWTCNHHQRLIVFNIQLTVHIQTICPTTDLRSSSLRRGLRRSTSLSWCLEETLSRIGKYVGCNPGHRLQEALVTYATWATQGSSSYRSAHRTGPLGTLSDLAFEREVYPNHPPFHLGLPFCSLYAFLEPITKKKGNKYLEGREFMSIYNYVLRTKLMDSVQQSPQWTGVDQRERGTFKLEDDAAQLWH